MFLRRVLGVSKAYRNACLLKLGGGDLRKARFPNTLINGVIYIDPQKVCFRCGLLTKEKTTDRFFWGGDWDLTLETIDHCEKNDYRYVSCRQMVVDGLPFESTDEYAYYKKKIGSGLKARGYRSTTKIDEYMRSVHGLYGSVVASREIKTQKSLGNNPFDGEINFVIGRTGELLKSDEGNHRFAIARVCGLRRIPVQVSMIHADLLDVILKSRKVGDDSVRAVNDFLLKVQSKYS